MMTPTLCSYTEATVWETDWACSGTNRSLRLALEGCKYCGTSLRSQSQCCGLADREDLYLCDLCGWWAYVYAFVEDLEGDRVPREYVVEADARHYSVDDLAAPLDDLESYLAGRPQDLAWVHPTKFELLLQRWLCERWKPCEVIHIGGTGDGGVDLLLVDNENEPILVQAKRRKNIGGTESVRVVRELNGVLFEHGLARGMIVTTARKFSLAAWRATMVATPTCNQYEMHLLAFDDIVGLLRLSFPRPYEPWAPFSDTLSLVLAGSVPVKKA